MRKVILTIAVLLMITLFAGCQPTQDNTIGPSKTPFIGGVEGLSMEFVPGAPPDKIFDNAGYPFSIDIKIENLGESDVKSNEGYVEITGINPKSFNLGSQDDLKKELPLDLRGVVKNHLGTVIVGDTIIVEFNDLNFLQNIRGNFDGPRIRANLCYNYQTEATTYVCVKRDLLSNIDTKEICELSGVKPVFNSGAPIQITEVTEDPLGSDKIQLTFTIEHVGTPNDRFYKYDTTCDDRQTNPDKDLVWFEVISDINNARAQCTGLKEANADKSGGFVELFNGEPRQIVCQIDVSSVDGIYEELVTAKLKYRYYQFIEKTVLVQDVSVNDR